MNDFLDYGYEDRYAGDGAPHVFALQETEKQVVSLPLESFDPLGVAWAARQSIRSHGGTVFPPLSLRAMVGVYMYTAKPVIATLRAQETELRQGGLRSISLFGSVGRGESETEKRRLQDQINRDRLRAF